jgi:nucleoside-diphosphate-sugar epimerase
VIVRIAVAGARGFIGGATARALEAAGHEVVAFDREGAPRTQVDALVWAAGAREIDLTANRAVHVTAAELAIDALAPRTLVYLSSGEVYGGAPVPFREDGPIDPRTPYAIAKREAESSLSAPVAIFLRPGVVYGPGQAPRMLVPRVIEAVRARTPIALTSGDQTRDFVFVDDLVELIVRCATEAAPAGIYNAGTGVETSIRQACLQIAGDRADLLRFGELPPRPDEQRRYVLDPAHTAAVLGWRARTQHFDTRSLEFGSTSHVH